MLDGSLDIETLGTSVDSVILSVGAIAFDPKDGSLYDHFYMNVDIWSALDAGLTIDDETLAVWRTPEFLEARLALHSNQRSIRHVLEKFAEWLNGPVNVQHVWAKPPQFDCALLGAAYKRLGMSVPWNHRAPRCLRTLLDVSEFDEKTIPFEGVKHHALDDARHQAKVVAAAKAKLSRPVSA